MNPWSFFFIGYVFSQPLVMNYTAKENQAQSGFLSPFLRPAKTKTGCSLSDIVSCQRLQPVFFFFISVQVARVIYKAASSMRCALLLRSCFYA